MARAQRQYVCQTCGTTHNKWAGKCEACNAWNSIVEEAALGEAVPRGLGRAKGKVIDLMPLSGVSEAPPRRGTGGGLVPGSALLIGGDPGIGKSTLLLQVTALLAGSTKCAYISGEEAVDQVRMRAHRLGFEKAPVALAAATNVRDIISTMD